MAFVPRVDRWYCDPIDIQPGVRLKTVRGRLAVWGKDQGWHVDEGTDGIMAMHRPPTVGGNPSHLSLCMDDLDKGSRVRGTLVTWSFGAGQESVHAARLASVLDAIQARH